MWGDIAKVAEAPEPELDKPTQKVLALIPPQMREMGEPFLRGYLLNAKAQVGEPAYSVFCGHLVEAYELHHNGDIIGADAILGQYGLSVAGMGGML
jgi:hypothetical protein